MTIVTPLTPVEEAVYHLERHTDSWNVHVEFASDEPIDADRLHDAAVAAGEHHPMARARLEPHGGIDTELRWRIPDDVEGLRCDSRSAGDDDELRRLRRSFYDDGFTLTDDLPYRLRHVAGPERDHVMLSACHVPCDGVGALRLARTVTRAYRDEPLTPQPVDVETARSAIDDARPDGAGGRLRQLANAAGHLRNTVDDPDRIAGASTADDLDHAWGFVCRTLELGTDVDVGARPDGASVNDVLLAALHRAIGAWNEGQGAPAGKLSLMMPVNLRPRDWFYDVVGNYALFDRVATRADDRRSQTATLDAVTEQTRVIKREDRAVALLESMELIPGSTPVGLRGRLTDFLRGPGRGLMDTAVMSNLGRVPTPPPAFHGDGPDGLWFSPPCRGPVAIGLGAVTAGDALALTFRYRAGHLDHEAADRFADGYVDAVERLLAAGH